MVKNKAYLCNVCRKAISYSRADAGKTIPCTFCGAPAKLPVDPLWTVNATCGKPRSWCCYFVVVVLALAMLGVVLFFRKQVVNVQTSAQQFTKAMSLLSDPQPTVAPSPVRVRGSRATVAVSEVVYGCPDIYEETLNRTSATETPVCCVKVTVTNTGKSVLPFRTWRIFEALADQKRARLRDMAGNDYSLVTYGVSSYPVGTRKQSDLAPQESLTDMVLFLCDAKPERDLKLVLPCENIGGKGELRFTIPRHLIR